MSTRDVEKTLQNVNNEINKQKTNYFSTNSHYIISHHCISFFEIKK